MAFGQMQWSSYDTSGNLVTANVATGGDAASASSVTFTVPANTRMFFITKSFTPIVLSQANSAAVVTYKFAASGGITGVAQKTVEWGLYNSMGTASLADDMGMFGGWTGSTVEGLVHTNASADLFTGASTGQGKTVTGAPTDGTTYTNQVRLFLKTAPNQVALGSSSSTLGASGIAMNGANITSRLFTNPGIWTNTVDEFALMFNNTTANPVTVTLSGVGLGNSTTWDASGANPVTPTDGSGIWSTTNATWSSGVGGAIGASDSVWFPGYNAVIGANNGAAGTITLTDPAGVAVSNITFNAATSGSYNVAASNGCPLILIGTPTITVASGVTATNSAQLGGTGFTKAGSGMLALSPTTNNTNVGPIIINAGIVNLASTTDSRIQLNGDTTVNAGGVLDFITTGPLLSSSTLTINGGAVTNINATAGKTLTIKKLVLDNNGTLGAAFSQATILMTNFDARSGLVAYPRIASSAQPTNFTVKSTAGTVTVQGGTGSSAGVQGMLVTLNGGMLLLDYLNPGLYGDNAVRGRLINTTTLTLGGGTLFLRSQGGSGRTEVVAGTTLNSGATALWATNTGTASGIGLTLNAVTRNVGGTVDSVTGAPNGGSASAAINTTSINNNGILGGWATWASSDWAVGSPAGALTAISAYSAYTTSTDPTTWAPANNVSLINPSITVGGGTNINSLKLTGNAAIALGGTLTLTSGGLLITGSAAPTITGGTLLGGSGADLIVQQYSAGDLTISSTLADNGSATSLTKSGPGKLIINGTDNMTGNNYLNGGTVEVSALAQLASGPLIMNNGTLRYTGSDASSSRSVTLNGVGATFDVIGGTKLTQTAAINGNGGFNSIFSGDNLGDWGGLTKIGNGTLVLAANNVYNGPTVVSNGVLSVNGTNSLSGTSGPTNYLGGGTFTVYGTLGGTGMISGAVNIKNGGTISPGNSIGTLTLGSSLTLESGSTSLFEEQNGSSGDLLQVQGNLTIQPNSTIAVSILGSALEPTTNTIITYTGTKTGSFNPTVALVGGSIDSSISIDESTPGQIKLVAVPQVALTCQPQDLIVSTNSPATFNVCATGTGPIGYQWYFYGNSTNNTPVLELNATNSSFTISNAQPSDTGLYAVVVSNLYNSVQSRFASLIVGDLCPVLTGPFDQTVIQGNNATFSTTVVIANPYPTFQWQTNSVNVDGATNTSVTLTNVQYAALNGATVSVIASNRACMTTNSATLTVIVTPVINPQPANITVNVGDTAVFVSGATGIPTPGLQWLKNNVVIVNQTNSTLTIANAQGSNIAGYQLVATNQAGSVTSVVARLTVDSTTLTNTAFGPTNGATGVCYDTPLYVTFNAPVFIVNSGRIRIYDSTNSVTPVDTIDMSSNTVVVSGGINLTNNIQPHSLFSGDSQAINYFPVIITGNTAAIYPHSGVLTSNQTYYVTIDNGIVADSTGAYFAGVSDTNAWRFTTKPTGPANPTNLVVAVDGSGDFVTVQGAVDSILPGNTNYTLVNIRDGNYVEIVDISGKSNISFLGQSRGGTVVGYPNNNNLNGSTASRMAFKVNASDIKLENLTLTNGTPQGGSQAETLLIYNNGLRCVIDSCDIKSRQDTVLINASTSQGYFNNCRIIGNFDYIWGIGVGYFNNCVFHTITNTLSSSYNLTAARTLTAGSVSTNTPWVNPNGTTYSAYGFSFVGCTFEADPGVTNITLAGSNGTAGGLDSWALSRFDISAYVGPVALSNTYVFWQYSNTDLAGNPISFPGLQTIGVTNNDPRLLAATNPVIWFSGWSPMLAPDITSQPTSLTVNAGQSANFTVSANGIPGPTYQWLKDTTNLVGQTSPMLSIGSASGLDIGTYYVIVSNGAGSVASSNAVLTVNPPTTPSTIASPSVDNSGNVQFTIAGPAGSAGFGYRVWASTNLALTPVPSTWTLLTNDVFGITPTIFTDATASGLPQRFYLITVP